MRRTLLALGLVALCGGEAGATCGALPFTFVNGTLANATQVNQNFTTLLNCINGTSITTVGTVTTGTWQATKIGLAYGGTNADLSATGGTSQFLKQASAGAAITVARPATSDLSDVAAFTNGSVPYVSSGALIQDNARLFWDNTNHRLGIGTTAPSGQATVVGAGQTSASFNPAGALGGTLLLSDTGASAGNGGAILFSANSQSFNFAAIKSLVTSGSDNSQGDLVVSVRPTTTDAALTEALRVKSSRVLQAAGYGAGTLYTDGSGNVSAAGANTVSTNGVMKLASGAIMEWGNITITGAASGAVTFPTAFSNIYMANCTFSAAQFCQASALTTSGFTANLGGSSTGTVYWIAIGS